MKKALALFLALVMCLSLTACGEKTQTVEITMDNWMDFFEVRKEIEWEENDFGEAECLQVYHALFIRDEYAESINPDSINLVFEYSEEGGLKTFDVDWENKELIEGELAESPNKKVFTATYNTTTGGSYHEQQPLMVHRFNTGTNMGLVGKDEYINKGLAEKDMADRFGYFFTNWQILRIEGTIEVKGELLDLPKPTTEATDIIVEPQPVVMETTVPETTVAPEPVYETIEITADNLWEYFEITQTHEFKEDTFGDTTGLYIFYNLAVKPEYQGCIDWAMSDVAVKLASQKQQYIINVDWNEKSFSTEFEEVAWDSEHTIEPNADIWQFDFDWRTSNSGTTLHGQSLNPEDYTILRIKGSLAFIK